MAKKIIHHYPGCIGCGACVGLCPQFFQLNETTYQAELIGGQAVTGSDGQPQTELTVEDSALLVQLDDSTADLLTASCPAQVIQVQNI